MTAIPAPSRFEVPLPRAIPAESPALRVQHRQQFMAQLRRYNAVLVAHYYTDPEIQRLAEETGGCVADSLQMARFGAEHPAQTLVVAGVRFMGETAKILSPHKRVLMPAQEATCSLDLGCPAGPFKRFCDQHPQRTVVVYANTSAAVKARADYVVTSSIAVELIDFLDGEGHQLIWGPDRHLGGYVAQKTGADMLLWQGECVVHDEFSAHALKAMQHQFPNAAVLVHPEAPSSVVEMADVVGSTSQLIQAARSRPQQQLIVATDRGIFYKMQQAVPDKELLIAPTAGEGATCRSCAHCPWMKMNTLGCLAEVFNCAENEIQVASDIVAKAVVPLNRMLEFAKSLNH